MLTVYVSTPNFWWRAPATHIRQWVPSDPDVDDGRTRWEDSQEQRWSLIADIVAQVSQALAGDSWTADDDGDAVITVPAPDLSETEERIVRSWFGAAMGVTIDPWWDAIVDGRHRLWRVLPLIGGTPVPIRGSALGYANEADIEVLGPTWHETFAEYPAQVKALGWFDQADPVNVRFLQALDSAARGEIPAPA